MTTIENLNDQPRQQITVALASGAQAVFTLEFKPQQAGWFYGLTIENFTVNGRRLVSAPNILAQYQNKLSFGIAVLTIDDADPTSQTAFVDGTTTLILLDAGDVAIANAPAGSNPADLTLVTWAQLKAYLAVVLGNAPGGDVTGPVVATDGHMAVFDGPSGKVIKDGGPPATGAVTSVNGHTGAVTLSASDVGADPSGSASTAQSNAETYADQYKGSTAGTANKPLAATDSTVTNARTPTGVAGGDLTGTFPNPTLAAIGSAAGPVGDSTHVAAVTIDAKGRVTALTPVAIAGGGTGDVVGPASAADSNFSQFNTTTGKLIKDGGYSPTSFVWRPRVPINVKDYGAKGDCIELTNAAITSGLAVLTSASNPFTSGDVGKLVFVAGAGASGHMLKTTIASFTNSGSVNLAATAGTTVSGAYCYFGTNDTTAFSNALAALPATRAALYIPAGMYLVPTQSFANIAGLAIYGDGRFVSVLKSSAFSDAGTGYNTPGSVVLEVKLTCSGLNVWNLGFDGSCNYRKPGQQAVVIDADHTVFAFNFTKNSGEYANTFGRNRTSPLMFDVQVIGNELGFNWADGYNFYRINGLVIANNIADGPDDDLIAVGECKRVQINGNVLTANDTLGTSWGRGIAILPGCDGVSGAGNTINLSKQYGLYIAAEGGTQPNNVNLVATTIRNAGTHSGSAIGVLTASNVVLDGTNVYNPASGNCAEIANWTNLTIKGGSMVQTLAQYCRGIHTPELNGYAGTASNLIISGVHFDMRAATSGGESVHLRPFNPAAWSLATAYSPGDNVTNAGHVYHCTVAVGPTATVPGSDPTHWDDWGTTASVLMTMDKVCVANCTSLNPIVTYISIDTNRATTAVKLVNNTSMEGNAISPSSSGGIITVANNN